MHSGDQNSLNSVPTVSPHMRSKVIFDNVPEGDHREDLPQLTRSRTTSPLESDNLSLTDECCPCDTIQHQDLQNKLDWCSDSPKTTSDTCELPTHSNEDALHFHYLRSRSPSPSASPLTGIGNDDDPSGRCSRTVLGEISPHAKKVCLSTIYLDHDVIEMRDASAKLKKPRISL